jgi:hypothetical protein
MVYYYQYFINLNRFVKIEAKNSQSEEQDRDSR